MESTPDRALTPAERYFAFADGVSSMNLQIVADLDIAPDPQLVAERWSDLVALRHRNLLQIHDDLTMSVAAPSGARFTHVVAPSAGWGDRLATDARRRVGVDRAPTCTYVTDPTSGGSRIVVSHHHATIDGRRGVAELQHFLRRLDGQTVPVQHGVPAPGRPRAGFDWQHDRRALLALLRENRSRQASPAPLTALHANGGGAQDVRFHDVDDTARGTDRLVATGRRRGVRAYSTLATSWLRAVAAVLGDPAHDVRLQLGTSVDLTAGDATASPAVGVMGSRHTIDDVPFWSLAEEVQESLDAGLRRGDPELFLLLSRAESIDDLGTGVAATRDALAKAPPTVNVTNLGVVDAGSDPSWVRGLHVTLPPTANQVIFVEGLTYRGRLRQTLCTSAAWLDDVGAAELAERQQATLDAALRWPIRRSRSRRPDDPDRPAHPLAGTA